MAVQRPCNWCKPPPPSLSLWRSLSYTHTHQQKRTSHILLRLRWIQAVQQDKPSTLNKLVSGEEIMIFGDPSHKSEHLPVLYRVGMYFSHTQTQLGAARSGLIHMLIESSKAACQTHLQSVRFLVVGTLINFGNPSQSLQQHHIL